MAESLGNPKWRGGVNRGDRSKPRKRRFRHRGISPLGPHRSDFGEQLVRPSPLRPCNDQCHCLHLTFTLFHVNVIFLCHKNKEDAPLPHPKERAGRCAQKRRARDEGAPPWTNPDGTSFHCGATMQIPAKPPASGVRLSHAGGRRQGASLRSSRLAPSARALMSACAPPPFALPSREGPAALAGADRQSASLTCSASRFRAVSAASHRSYEERGAKPLEENDAASTREKPMRRSHQSWSLWAGAYPRTPARIVGDATSTFWSLRTQRHPSAAANPLRSGGEVRPPMHLKSGSRTNSRSK